MIKELAKDDIKQALELVNRVFTEFVAVDFSEEGNKTYSEYLKIKFEDVSGDIQSGHKKAWAYYEDNTIIGVIVTREVSHITLMFVDKQHHNRGIARQLFNTVLEHVQRNKDIKQMTVNSSPYAVEVYERFGFIKTSEPQENNGIICIPMTKELA
jgi:predicted GNAT family N-acyltransferase